MAVNFGDTLMEGSIEPSAVVQSPVQDNSGAVLAEGFSSAASAIGQIAGSIFKGAQDDANAKILTNYENDLLDLADSVDQGTVTRNEAMIKARNLRRQYLANAPALQDDFDTVWSDFAGSSGLGHVVVEGTVEQQAQEARMTEAIKLGYPSVEAYNLFQTRARELAALNQEVSIIQGQGQLITESQRNKYIQATVGVAESAYPAAQRQINEAMASINANPNNKAEIAANLNVVLGQSIAQLEYLTGNSPDNAYITTPIKTAMDTFNKWVNGEVSQSVMEGQLKITQQSYNLMYATDPILGPIIAQSKLINDLGLANTVLGVNIWTPEAIKKLADVSTPNQTVNIVDETEGSARFMDNVKQAAGYVTDSSDPEYIQEVRTSIEQMIDSAYVHERSATGGAMSYKDLVNNLGSPEIGQFIATHGISPKYAQQTVEVLKAAYEQELIPVVNREWANTAFVGDIPVSDIVEPKWNGNALEFVPKGEWANDINARYLATELNTGDNSMAIPINNLINTYANLTGVDAGKIYEEDFANRLFGVGEENSTIADRVNNTLDNMAADSVEGSFNLSDFQPDELETISIDNASNNERLSNIDSGTFIEPTSNPNVNSEVLDKFEGKRLPVSIRNNNMGAISITGNVDNSWAAKQPGFIGVTPRPANEGGYYAKFATPEHGVAAASQLLQLYGRQGIDTAASIVRKWSASTASHNAYQNMLVKYLNEAGISATATSKLNLESPIVRMAILKAKSAHESGAGIPIYNDSVFQRGVGL